MLGLRWISHIQLRIVPVLLNFPLAPAQFRGASTNTAVSAPGIPRRPSEALAVEREIELIGKVDVVADVRHEMKTLSLSVELCACPMATPCTI